MVFKMLKWLNSRGLLPIIGHRGPWDPVLISSDNAHYWPGVPVPVPVLGGGASCSAQCCWCSMLCCSQLKISRKSSFLPFYPPFIPNTNHTNYSLACPCSLFSFPFPLSGPFFPFRACLSYTFPSLLYFPYLSLENRIPKEEERRRKEKKRKKEKKKAEASRLGSSFVTPQPRLPRGQPRLSYQDLHSQQLRHPGKFFFFSFPPSKGQILVFSPSTPLSRITPFFLFFSSVIIF